MNGGRQYTGMIEWQPQIWIFLLLQPSHNFCVQSPFFPSYIPQVAESVDPVTIILSAPKEVEAAALAALAALALRHAEILPLHVITVALMESASHKKRVKTKFRTFYTRFCTTLSLLALGLGVAVF